MIGLIRDDERLADCKIADYGTRRRFSRIWQEEMLGTLRTRLGSQFAGTSNTWFAMTQHLTPLGTMAHEYLQACQSLGPRLRVNATTTGIARSASRGQSIVLPRA